ncbi:hypothetical protein BSL78_20069, partial [Apostichopus japonicus]
ETFWRIPGNLSIEGLRQRAEAIEPGMETESVKKQRERHRMLEQLASKQKEQKKTRKPRKKMMTAEEVLEKLSAPESPGNGDTQGGGGVDMNEVEKRKTPPSKSRVKRPLDSGSSSEDSDDEPLGDLVMKRNAAPSQPAKRSRVALSSDSEDNEPIIREEAMESGDRIQETGLEEEPKVSEKSHKSRSVLDSDDSDSDDDVPVGVLVQRRAALIESDEESGED